MELEKNIKQIKLLQGYINIILYHGEQVVHCQALHVDIV